MSEHLLTPAQHGGSVRAALGDTLLLRLPENPTTGYRWQFELPAGLGVSSDDFVMATSAAGAGGERTLRLLASAPGLHRLAAALRRPWETSGAAGGEPAGLFVVTITVA